MHRIVIVFIFNAFFYPFDFHNTIKLQIEKYCKFFSNSKTNEDLFYLGWMKKGQKYLLPDEVILPDGIVVQEALPIMNRRMN